MKGSEMETVATSDNPAKGQNPRRRIPCKAVGSGSTNQRLGGQSPSSPIWVRHGVRTDLTVPPGQQL